MVESKRAASLSGVVKLTQKCLWLFAGPQLDPLPRPGWRLRAYLQDPPAPLVHAPDQSFPGALALLLAARALGCVQLDGRPRHVPVRCGTVLH